MKLNELSVRLNIPGRKVMPFIEPNPAKLSYLGKLGSGENVYKMAIPGEKHILFYAKNASDYMCMTSLEPMSIPKIGKVFYSHVTHTKEKYAGKFLSFRLRFFIRQKYNMPILLGDTHTLDTQNALLSLSKKDLFKMYMVNVKTGDKLPWSKDTYEKKTGTSQTGPTDWHVLLETVMTGKITNKFEDIEDDTDLVCNPIICLLECEEDKIFDF